MNGSVQGFVIKDDVERSLRSQPTSRILLLSKKKLPLPYV